MALKNYPLRDTQKTEFKYEEVECPIIDFEYNPLTVSGSFRKRFISPNVPAREPKKLMQPYIPSEEIKELVRLAQILKRPVLIKGEPGSGKTQLAKAVAYDWYGENYKEHYFEWSIKSTSKSVDGLYTFDHVGRLRNAYLRQAPAALASTTEDLRSYRQFGPMGKAFLTSTEENPSILLIDEIDKADIDFPNDLLLELDEKRFVIPESETGEAIIARHPPLIFITSNDERELPEAFLRRCLFYYITFPDDALLLRIIKAHLPGLVEKHLTLVEAAIQEFNNLRKTLRNDTADNKRVSTSELLDWLKAYDHDINDGRSPDKAGVKNFPLYYQALLKTFASVSRRDSLMKNPDKA